MKLNFFMKASMLLTLNQIKSTDKVDNTKKYSVFKDGYNQIAFTAVVISIFVSHFVLKNKFKKYRFYYAVALIICLSIFAVRYYLNYDKAITAPVVSVKQAEGNKDVAPTGEESKPENKDSTVTEEEDKKEAIEAK